jgi:hypothetical protein
MTLLACMIRVLFRSYENVLADEMCKSANVSSASSKKVDALFRRELAMLLNFKRFPSVGCFRPNGRRSEASSWREHGNLSVVIKRPRASDSGFRERAVASQRGRREEFSSAETKARALRWKPAPEQEFK